MFYATGCKRLLFFDLPCFIEAGFVAFTNKNLRLQKLVKTKTLEEFNTFLRLLH
jgi:hypothetical protein